MVEDVDGIAPAPARTNRRIARKTLATSNRRAEILWNKLAQTHTFSLLCGYSMGNFCKQTAQFEAVCKQHSHVIGPGTVVPFERRTVSRTG